MTQLILKVLRKFGETENISSFELAAVDGSPLPVFSAGSHIDVHLPNGMTRQYSICNDDAEQHRYRIAVLRDPETRGGSRAMHDDVHVGDLIPISAPRNHFPLIQARRTLLVAGGIGVTPLLCMAYRLARAGADFHLHYCTRTVERTAFRHEIAASAFAGKVSFHHSDGPSDQKLDANALLARPMPGTHLYVCGPAGFIDHVTGAANACGWAADHIHQEHFGAPVQDTSTDGDFQVRIASSGKTYRVPAGKTVVNVLHQHGIDILVSCEQGVCGTCITRVLQGECEHRDMYFTDDEKAANDQFTPCVSRARSEVLVLDI